MSANCQGLPGIGIAVVSTRGTAVAAGRGIRQWFEIRPENPERLADFEITAISVSHDAAQPCGYFLRCGQAALTVLTDLGCASGAATEAISRFRSRHPWKRITTRPASQRPLSAPSEATHCVGRRPSLEPLEW